MSDGGFYRVDHGILGRHRRRGGIFLRLGEVHGGEDLCAERRFEQNRKAAGRFGTGLQKRRQQRGHSQNQHSSGAADGRNETH